MMKFVKWLENKENSALSPPQHKADEASKSLDEVVGKRLMQLAMEMETQGKGSRQDVLKSIERVIGTVSKNQQGQQSQQGQQGQSDPNMGMDPNMDPNMGMQQQNPIV